MRVPDNLPAALGEPKPVYRSDALADSVGVNVHMAYLPSNYRELDPVSGTDAQWPLVVDTLNQLGVRYVRDHLPMDDRVEGFFIRLAQQQGVKLSAIVPPASYLPVDEIVSRLRRLAAAGTLASIEAPNEPDNPPSQFDPAPIQQLQKDLYAALKSDPVLEQIPLLVSPLVSKEGHEMLGDLSSIADQGNIHPYALARSYGPEVLDEYLTWARDVSADLPLQATETGYTGALMPADDFGGLVGVSVRAAGSYIPKTLLWNFSYNILRTYIYELMDEMLDGSLTGPSHDPAFARQLADPRYHQARFGIVEADFSPKPAFRALRNLIRLTADPGPTFSPAPLGYELQGEGVRSLLVQRSDGDHLLFLWVDVELCVPEMLHGVPQRARELYPPGIDAKIVLESDRAAWIHHLGISHLPIAHHQPGPTIELVVPPDDVAVLRLSTSAPPIAMAGAPA